MRNTLLLLAVSAIFSFPWGNARAAHPAEDYLPPLLPPVPYRYPAGEPAEWSIGDIVFIPPAERPPADQLSPMEVYMLAGASAPDQARGGLTPWYSHVAFTVSLFHDAYGYVPDQLTPEFIRRIPGYDQLSDELLDYLRNPLTEEWPRLRKSAHSPGDMYMRPLTTEEMRSIAEKDESGWYRNVWFEGKALDWDALDAGTPYSECFTREVSLTSEVYYMRIYGRTGTIMTTLWFSTRTS